MFIKNDSRDDIKMRWGGCFINTKKGLFSISEITSLNSTSVDFLGHLQIDMGSYFTWSPFEGSLLLTEVDIAFPTLGAAMWRNDAVYYSLSSKIVRKLGMHQERISAYNIKTGNRNCSSAEVANLYLGNRYSKIKEFLAKADKGESAVLTKYLYSTLMKIEGTQKMILCRAGDIIGTCYSGKILLPERNVLCRQEIEEAGLEVQLVGEIQ